MTAGNSDSVRLGSDGLPVCPTCLGRWAGDPEGSGLPCDDPFHANNPRWPR